MSDCNCYFNLALPCPNCKKVATKDTYIKCARKINMCPFCKRQICYQCGIVLKKDGEFSGYISSMFVNEERERKNHYEKFLSVHTDTAYHSMCAIKDGLLLDKVQIEKDDNFIKNALIANPENIRFIKNPSLELLLCVFKINKNLIEYIDSPPQELSLLAIEEDAFYYKFINNRTQEFDRLAVERNPQVIRYIHNQTEEMCFTVLNHDVTLFKYIKNPTKEMCLAAVVRDGKLLMNIKDQTEEICLAAVKNNHIALKFVHNRTPAIIEAALRKNGYALFYIPIAERTDEMYRIAVESNPLALKYVYRQTEEMCLDCVRRDGNAIDFVKNVTDKIKIEAIKSCPGLLFEMRVKTPEMFKAAVEASPVMLEYLDDQTKEDCLNAVKRNGMTLKYANYKDEDVINAAICENKNAIIYK